MDNLMQAPLTICLSKVALAAGTTTTLSTTGTTTFGVKGKAYTQAAITNGATPTLDSTTGLAFTPIAANQGSVFLVGLAGGSSTLQVSQGQVMPLDVSGNFMQSAPSFPEVPDTVCPIGYIVVKAGATAVGTWTMGTNNNSGVTGLTYTFQDLITLPGRPQVS